MNEYHVRGTEAFPLNPDHDFVVTPGETLRELLDEQNLTQAELARRAGLSTKHVNQVLQGVAALSADVAQRIEMVTGTPTRLWLRMEADYQSHLAQQRQALTERASVGWVREMPVRPLVDAGYLPEEPSDAGSRVGQLLRFFAVATVDAYRALAAPSPRVAFRQSTAHKVDWNAVAAWLRIGEIEASVSETVPFDAARLRAALPRFRELTTLSPHDFLPRLTSLAAEVGLVVVFVAEVPGARSFGAARWIGGNPVIQVSLRGKTTDRFWRTFFHEVAHVLLHDRKDVFVEPADEDHSVLDEREREADAFSRSVLFGDTKLAPHLREHDVIQLAAEMRVEPGIVVSELQHLGLWDWSQGNTLKHHIHDSDLRTVDLPPNTRFQRRRKWHLPGSE